MGNLQFNKRHWTCWFRPMPRRIFGSFDFSWQSTAAVIPRMSQEPGTSSYLKAFTKSHTVPLNFQDIPTFNLQPHHFKEVSSGKSLTLTRKITSPLWTQEKLRKLEKHCIVDFICGNLFLLKKKKSH